MTAPHNAQEASDALVFDVVKTSIGRCFRIGTQEEIDKHEASKFSGPRIPAYACIYDDGEYDLKRENNASRRAAFIVTAVNAHARLLAENAALRAALERDLTQLREERDGLRKFIEGVLQDSDRVLLPPSWKDAARTLLAWVEGRKSP